MSEERPFWTATVVVGCFFLFIAGNLFFLTWFVLDDGPLGHQLGNAAMKSILDLGEKSKFRNYWEIVFLITSSGLAVSAGLRVFSCALAAAFGRKCPTCQ